MSIVVIPKTEAQCNQVRSILQSHGCQLFATCKVDAVITVGKVVICWDDADKDYAVRSVQDDVLNVLTAEEVPVNALYEWLQR